MKTLRTTSILLVEKCLQAGKLMYEKLTTPSLRSTPPEEGNYVRKLEAYGTQNCKDEI